MAFEEDLLISNEELSAGEVFVPGCAIGEFVPTAENGKRAAVSMFRTDGGVTIAAQRCTGTLLLARRYDEQPTQGEMLADYLSTAWEGAELPYAVPKGEASECVVGDGWSVGGETGSPATMTANGEQWVRCGKTERTDVATVCRFVVYSENGIIADVVNDGAYVGDPRTCRMRTPLKAYENGARAEYRWMSSSAYRVSEQGDGKVLWSEAKDGERFVVNVPPRRPARVSVSRG